MTYEQSCPVSRVSRGIAATEEREDRILVKSMTYETSKLLILHDFHPETDVGEGISHISDAHGVVAFEELVHKNIGVENTSNHDKWFRHNIKLPNYLNYHVAC